MKRYDFIILGGGIAGLLAALSLSKLQVRIAVVEKSKYPLSQNARVVALNAASLNVLQHLNVMHFPQSPVMRMQVWDQAADGQIVFDQQATCHDKLGAIVENYILANTLFEASDAQNGIELMLGTTVESLDVDAGVVRLSNGQVLQAELVIGADGVHSVCRKQAGIETKDYDYQQTATVATIECEKPHLQTAFQCFTSRGPIALLPLADPHQVSLVWSTNADLSSVAFEQALASEVQYVLGKMKLVTPRQAFPLKRQHAKQYWHKKCVLIGDAAHVIHPLAGQGLNLAFMDVGTLYDMLTKWIAAGKQNLSRYLNQYQRHRRAHASLLNVTMDSFHFGFKSRNISLISLRNWGINAVNQTPMIKNQLIKVALGEIGFTIPDLGRRIYHGRAEQTNPVEADTIL